MKLHKHQTLIAILSLAVLLAASAFQWTPLAGKFAAWVAESPVRTLVERHIVHKTFDSKFILMNVENLLKGISGACIILSLFLLFTARGKFLPVCKLVCGVLRKLFNGAAQALNSYLSNQAALFFLCGFFGVLFFITTFGTAILDVTYTDWLMEGGDLSQHYLGWRMFRNSAWHFPLGLMDNIVYPFKESVIYTDSIPLFALLFKAASPLLPENFQYFGIFGLVIYFLQGGAAALVIQKIGKNGFYAILGSFFFIFSTTMMQRIYGHTSLAAHFIILLCMDACMPRTKRSMRGNILVWGGLFALAVSLHIYFVPVVFVFMAVYLIKEYLEDRIIKDKMITASISIAAGLAVMFVLGAFYSGADPASGLLGESSMNLNALFNPQNTSRFLKGLPLATRFQYEGYGYLGFGVLSGCLLLLSPLLKEGKALKNIFQTGAYKKNSILIFALFLFFFIFALSPAISLNGKILFRYYIPIVNYVWSIFRSTGRYVWVLMYIIMLVLLWGIKKQFGAKKGLVILCALLALQYVDLKTYFFEKGSAFKRRVVWETPLASPKWNVITENKKHIVFLQGYVNSYPFLDLAIRRGLTTNDSYLARKNSKQINRFKDEEKSRILTGGADEASIYLFETADEAEKYRDMLDISVIDGVITGVKN